MLKFLLIIFLISYVIYKVGGFLFRMLFLKVTQQQFHREGQQPRQPRRAPGGNVNIDYVPENQKSKKDGFSGGDYVEYEDVKE